MTLLDITKPRIDKSSYRLFTDHVVYEPVAGVTIKNAIEESIIIANFEKMPVELRMNDITITITKNTSPSVAVNRYLSKLERSYRTKTLQQQIEKQK